MVFCDNIIFLCNIVMGKRIVKFKFNKKYYVEFDKFWWIGDIFLYNIFF